MPAADAKLAYRERGVSALANATYGKLRAWVRRRSRIRDAGHGDVRLTRPGRDGLNWRCSLCEMHAQSHIMCEHPRVCWLRCTLPPVDAATDVLTGDARSQATARHEGVIQ